MARNATPVLAAPPFSVQSALCSASNHSHRKFDPSARLQHQARITHYNHCAFARSLFKALSSQNCPPACPIGRTVIEKSFAPQRTIRIRHHQQVPQLDRDQLQTKPERLSLPNLWRLLYCYVRPIPLSPIYGEGQGELMDSPLQVCDRYVDLEAMLTATPLQRKSSLPLHGRS